MRKLNYALAINEALHQMMAEDESVFLIGQGVKSPWYVVLITTIFMGVKAVIILTL